MLSEAFYCILCYLKSRKLLSWLKINEWFNRKWKILFENKQFYLLSFTFLIHAFSSSTDALMTWKPFKEYFFPSFSTKLEFFPPSNLLLHVIIVDIWWYLTENGESHSSWYLQITQISLKVCQKFSLFI